MAEALVMVPSGSMARKGLAPFNPNRLDVGVGLTLCVPSGPLPAPSTHSGREVKTELQCLSRFGRRPQDSLGAGALQGGISSDSACEPAAATAAGSRASCFLPL